MVFFGDWTLRPRLRFLLALGGLVSLSGLSGCVLITDTSRMNPDVFAAETRPTWDRPQVTTAPPPPTPSISERFHNLFMPSTAGNDVRMHQNAQATSSLTTSSISSYPQVTGSALAYQQPMPPATGPVSAAVEVADATPGPFSPFSLPPQKALYGQMHDGGHTLNPLPLDRIERRFLRQEVAYQTDERPGTIIVDTKAHYLYFIEGNGRATRYGVGLGRQGFAWHGRGVIQFKRQWPRWVPSDDMVERQPEMRPIAASRGGLEPGTNNPLGARALYIFQNGRDTLYRIHGTPDWQSVGKAVSSGCVRMFNQDVIDLYARVRERAEIVVI